jgi:hypothetical protein
MLTKTFDQRNQDDTISQFIWYSDFVIIEIDRSHHCEHHLYFHLSRAFSILLFFIKPGLFEISIPVTFMIMFIYYVLFK